VGRSRELTELFKARQGIDILHPKRGKVFKKSKLKSESSKRKKTQKNLPPSHTRGKGGKSPYRAKGASGGVSWGTKNIAEVKRTAVFTGGHDYPNTL